MGIGRGRRRELARRRSNIFLARIPVVDSCARETASKIDVRLMARIGVTRNPEIRALAFWLAVARRGGDGMEGGEAPVPVSSAPTFDGNRRRHKGGGRDDDERHMTKRDGDERQRRCMPAPKLEAVICYFFFHFVRYFCMRGTTRRQ